MKTFDGRKKSRNLECMLVCNVTMLCMRICISNNFLLFIFIIQFCYAFFWSLFYFVQHKPRKISFWVKIQWFSRKRIIFHRFLPRFFFVFHFIHIQAMTTMFDYENGSPQPANLFAIIEKEKKKKKVIMKKKSNEG